MMIISDHTISRSGEVIVGSPMRRSRSVPDRKGLTPDNDNQKLSAMVSKLKHFIYLSKLAVKKKN